MTTDSVVTHEQQEARDYLDRVALEAMRIILTSRTGVVQADDIAAGSYAIARAMLKARSQGGAV